MSEVVPANAALMNFIERAARDDSFDIQKFGELLRLQRELQHDQARQLFNAAMADAQSEMLPVVRDAKNTHLGNRYAKLETIDAAMRPIYTRHGFSVRFGSAPSPREGDIRIICTVAHSGGYFEENHLDAPLGTTGVQGGRTQTTPVQGVGSAVTYLRRYLLGMVFNIVLADDDDDGEFAHRPVAATATPRPATIARATAPVTRTDSQWQAWLAKADAGMRTLYRRSELEDLARKPTVAEPHATGPEWVRAELDRLLAENTARIAKLEGSPIDNAPEHGAAADELPAIAGEEKAGAG